MQRLEGSKTIKTFKFCMLCTTFQFCRKFLKICSSTAPTVASWHLRMKDRRCCFAQTMLSCLPFPPFSDVWGQEKSKMRRSACRLVMCGRIFFTWFIWWTYVKVAFETVVLLVRAVLTVADWLWKFTQRWDRVVVYSWILLCRTHQNPFWRAQTQRYGLHTTKRCPDQLLKVKRQS